MHDKRLLRSEAKILEQFKLRHIRSKGPKLCDCLSVQICANEVRREQAQLPDFVSREKRTTIYADGATM